MGKSARRIGKETEINEKREIMQNKKEIEQNKTADKFDKSKDISNRREGSKIPRQSQAIKQNRIFIDNEITFH